ncbi:MAG: ABC transporter ATP-binding protein [Burkholderiales bacterium]
MIDIEQLRYRWPRGQRDVLAIDGLHIAAGRSVFLFGDSGCGKSTLLGLMAGVLLPQAGRVTVLGQNWQQLSASGRDGFRADHVGHIFQQFNLLPYLSVLDNVLLPCRFSKRRAQQAVEACGSATQQAATLLTHMGLPQAMWQQRASELSVGQQQRVAAGRALMGQPELVIADEPTSALDAARRDSFMQLLRGLCREQRTTLVFVSHDERLAEGFDQTISLPELNRASSGVLA